MVHPAEMLQNVERVGGCVRECSAVGEQHEDKQRRRAIHSAHQEDYRVVSCKIDIWSYMIKIGEASLFKSEMKISDKKDEHLGV